MDLDYQLDFKYDLMNTEADLQDHVIQNFNRMELQIRENYR